MSSTPSALPSTGASSSYRKRRWREAALAYLFLAPSAVIVGAFGFLPLLNALLISLRDWRLTPGDWIGIRNYQQAFQSPDLWQSLLVTVYYVVGTVPATLILGYFIAELLSARIRGLAAYRAVFFLPYIVSPVAAAAVWKWILNPNFGLATAVAQRFGWEPRWLQETAGIFTLLGQALHLPVPHWAAGPSLALVCIIVVSIWNTLGFAVVVLLAGLAAIPPEITEAARLDGARGWRLLRYVKLPLLSPTLFFLLVVFTIRAFQTFTQIYVLSVDNQGGPDGATRNITLYIVQSFNDHAPRLGPGYGSAVAMVLFAIILVLTLIQFRVLGKRVHYN
jgi:multiple sugar transport system permease protein